MGCGGSNMNPKQKPVPSRLRPILWRRYEDIPGRSNTSRAIGNNDNSKKKPLMIKGGTKEYHSIKGKNNLDPHNTNFQRTHHHEHIEQKVVILPPCSTLSSNNNVGDVDEEKIALNEKNAPLCYNDKMDYEDVKVVKESEKERGLDERKNEEETMSIDQNEMVGASPSFRVYCKTNIDLICEEEYDAKRDSSNLLAHEASFRLLGQMQDADAIPTRESIHNDFSLHPIVGHKAPEALGAIGPKTCESDLCRIEEMKNHGRNDKKPSPYLSSSSSKSKLRNV